MAKKVEPLYFGDMRLDSLHQRLADVISDLPEGIPIVSVIGVLESVKADLLDRLKED